MFAWVMGIKGVCIFGKEQNKTWKTWSIENIMYNVIIIDYLYQLVDQPFKGQFMTSSGLTLYMAELPQ